MELTRKSSTKLATQWGETKFDYCESIVLASARLCPTKPIPSEWAWRRLMAGFIQSWSCVRWAGQKEIET